MKYAPKVALRTSMSNYRQEETLINLLLYAISQIQKACEPNYYKDYYDK